MECIVCARCLTRVFMNIEVITIGHELLNGRRADTNTVFLGNFFANFGLMIRFRQSVQDVRNDIEDAITKASHRSDLVIITGGLGPTQDDITFEALAHVIQKPLEFHQDVLHAIEKRYQARGFAMPLSNRRQAMIPEGVTILANKVGTAPGCQLTLNQAEIFVMPGVPSEMKGMCSIYLMPWLQKRLKHTETKPSIEYALFGLPEAMFEEMVLTDLQTFPWGKDVEYSVTASFPLVTFTFRIAQASFLLVQKSLEELFFSKYSQYLWRFCEKSIEEHINLKLKEKKWILSVAESCTGGMLASKLVDVPGASEVFAQGLITYSNESKISLLGVSSETISQFGAVSSQCALEMAQGLRKQYGADVAIATTGIAGPTGATENKPIGRTYVAWVGHGFEDVAEYTFTKDRTSNRILTTYHALTGLYQRIKE